MLWTFKIQVMLSVFTPWSGKNTHLKLADSSLLLLKLSNDTSDRVQVNKPANGPHILQSTANVPAVLYAVQADVIECTVSMIIHF